MFTEQHLIASVLIPFDLCEMLLIRQGDLGEEPICTGGLRVGGAVGLRRLSVFSPQPACFRIATYLSSTQWFKDGLRTGVEGVPGGDSAGRTLHSHWTPVIQDR